MRIKEAFENNVLTGQELSAPLFQCKCAIQLAV